MKEDLPGSLLGGMLLVAGCCIGAGMLALPVLTGLVGFFPSLLMLGLSWAFMYYTGLLLIEINGRFYENVDLLTMVKKGLGPIAYWIAWGCYTLLFYSLLVAYIDGAGGIFQAIFEQLFGWKLSSHLASIFFVAVFGFIIYLGTRAVDLFNRVMMLFLMIAYFAMIAVGIQRIEGSYLLHFDFHKLFLSFPILVLSFGFQNLVPTLTSYMKGDLKRVRLSILGGGSIVFFVYFLWLLVVLGIVPYPTLLEHYRLGKEATAALQTSHSSFLVHSSQLFALFAVITSFLPVGLTLSHFLSDGFAVLRLEKEKKWPFFLAILPPLIFALIYPCFFFHALSFAGGICAMILFGIFPISMVFMGRYIHKEPSNYHAKGGKLGLFLAFSFALFVLICELVRICST